MCPGLGRISGAEEHLRGAQEESWVEASGSPSNLARSLHPDEINSMYMRGRVGGGESAITLASSIE